MPVCGGRRLDPKGSPGTSAGGAVFLAIGVQVYIRKREAAGQRLLRSFQAQISLQLLIAQVRCVLIGHAPLGKRLVGMVKVNWRFSAFGSITK